MSSSLIRKILFKAHTPSIISILSNCLSLIVTRVALIPSFHQVDQLIASLVAPDADDLVA
jgi:hypothetical protein